MKKVLIMLVIIGVLTAALIVTIKLLIEHKKEIKSLKEELEVQQQNIISLYKHAEEIAEIEKDRRKTDEEINESKTDEEMLDIINTVIAVNNNRVQNNSKK